MRILQGCLGLLQKGWPVIKWWTTRCSTGSIFIPERLQTTTRDSQGIGLLVQPAPDLKQVP